MFVDRRVASPFNGVDPFFSGFGFGPNPLLHSAARKRRAHEVEAARRREAWELEQRRRRAALRSRRDQLARRVWGRTYNRAAAVIQQCWRAHRRRISKARSDAAASTITRAVRNAGAVASGRRIAHALRELKEIEAEAMAVPAALDTERNQLWFEDTLEKITLRLDRVDSLGSPLVRERRRAVVRAVQGRLARLDDHRSSESGSETSSAVCDSEVDADVDAEVSAELNAEVDESEIDEAEIDESELDESELESEVASEDTGRVDVTVAPESLEAEASGEAFDDLDGWTEVTDAEFEAAVSRRNELWQMVASARAELASLEAQLTASESEVSAMEGGRALTAR